MNVAELTTQYGTTYTPPPVQPINSISPEQSLANQYGATYTPASQPIPETGYLGTAYNAITHSVDLAGQGGQQVAQGIKEGDIVKSLTGIARVGGGILSTIAAPFSALSAVVDKVPVLKPLNDLINATASIPGTVAQFPIDKAINSLPMTQEHKDLIHQATQEITSIGGQLWFFAKIGEGFGKGEVIDKTKIDALKEQANNLNEKVTAPTAPTIPNEPTTPQAIADTYGATYTPPAEISKPAETAIPKELQPLAQEARKYKSAEEFVGAMKSGSDRVDIAKRRYQSMNLNPTEIGSYSIFDIGRMKQEDMGDLNQWKLSKQDLSIKSDLISQEIFNKAREKGLSAGEFTKNGKISIYRVVPRGQKINAGDFVFDTKSAAEKYLKEYGVKRGATEIQIVKNVGLDELLITDNPLHNYEELKKSRGEFIYAPKELQNSIKDESQLTDFYNQVKGAETPITERIGKETLIENKTSGVAKSIEAKAIEQGLINRGFDKLAGYDASTIKEQANIFSDILNNKGEEGIRTILRGEESLPERARSGAFIVAGEEYLKTHPNQDLAYDLANSPHTSAFSQAGSELGLAQNRVQDSFTQKTEEIKKAREARNPIKSSEVKTQLKTEMDKMNLSESDLGKLEKFIDNNIC